MSDTSYEQLEIPLLNGGSTVVDCAARVGPMAVTRVLSGEGWTLTYLPVGYRIPYNFTLETVAEACLRRIDEVVDWPGFVETFANGGEPNAADEVSKICVAFGGIHKKSQYDHERMSTSLRQAIDDHNGEPGPPNCDGGHSE
jgi:hypothetical protein